MRQGSENIFKGVLYLCGSALAGSGAKYFCSPFSIPKRIRYYQPILLLLISAKYAEYYNLSKILMKKKTPRQKLFSYL